jgi:hypothetical protein
VLKRDDVALLIEEHRREKKVNGIEDRMPAGKTEI